MRRSLTVAALLLWVLSAAPGFAAQGRKGAPRGRAVTAGASLSVAGLWGRLLATLGLDAAKPTGTTTATTTPPPVDVGGGMDPNG